MSDVSDSDDSTFLFFTTFSKVKDKTHVGETKKEKSTGDLLRNEIINLNEEVKFKKERSSVMENNCNGIYNNLNQNELGKESFENCMVVDESLTLKNEYNIQLKPVLRSKVTDYYSCPLCLKTFDTEVTHVSHMKQCAKKSKMTPKQLLLKLEMHKDQLKKRVHPGFSPLSPLRKRKKTTNQDNPESYELALGLALSKSLSEVNQNGLGSNNTSFKNNVKNNRATLETFGFTNSNCNFGGTGRRKLKNWKNAHFALRERTKQQRETLITEKASIILLCNDYEVVSCTKLKQEGLYDLENEKKEYFWKLGENENNMDWYVQSIKYFLLDETKESVNGKSTRNFKECNIVEEIKRLNLPQTSVLQDWKKLVNNKYLSDLNFRSKSSEILYLHSVVLYARCPKALDLDLQSILGRFNTATILSFLQYLYCGVLDGLNISEIENLFNLAKSVNFEELCQILSILKENLNLISSQADEVTPELNETLRLKEENRRENLDESMKLQNTLQYEELLKVYNRDSDFDSNISLGENVTPNCAFEQVGNESNQDMLRNSEMKEEALWEPHKTENIVENVETDEKINLTLNGKEDENVISCINKKNILSNELSKCYDKCSKVEDLERDMFEEDISGQISKITDHVNINSPQSEDNGNECILVSSGSSKEGFSNEGRREELEEKNEEFPLFDCEIPYFDPYEHFCSEIPVPDSPILNEEHVLQSQSLFHNEISRGELSSPCREKSPHDKNIFQELETISPITVTATSQASDFCSTPIIALDKLQSSANRSKSSRKCLKKELGKKSQSLCFKRSRSVIASRLMRNKLMRSSSAKKKRSILKDVKYDEEDSDKDKDEDIVDILTESILKNFESSFGVTPNKNPKTPVRKFIEMTPAATGEEFSEDVSPLPDYSIMNASGIKEHLTKYGLKKSLSKNKAKKILRHIYEELHPLINAKNGKIIKYESVEKQTCTKKISESKRKSSLKNKNLRLVKEKPNNKARVRKASCTNSNEDSSTPTKSEAEDNTSPSDSTNSLDRSGEQIFERSDSEIQESQSQTSFSSAKDVTEAVFEFIHSNADIHRRILMYEPIWLENFREQLYEKYNKKFKLTDLMDCLDAECITFRCESQRRTNRTRKNKTKSNNSKKK